MGRFRSVAGIAVAAAVLLSGCGTDDEVARDVPVPDTAIKVGSADFTESRILAEIFAVSLEGAGLDVRRRYGIGAREEYLQRIDAGRVDIVPEYIGSLTENLNRIENGRDPEPLASGDPGETTDALRALLEPYDAVAVDPAPAQSQNAFAVSRSLARKEGLTTISDLRKLNGTLVAGGPVECAEQPTCLIGLQEVYGLEFKRLRRLDTGGPKTLDALEDGRVDVGLVFSADGSVEARRLVVLEDDKQLQFAENITALLPGSLAAPEVVDPLTMATQALTTDDLRRLNRQVNERGLTVDYVAASWAADQGLISSSAVPPRTTNNEQVPREATTEQPTEGPSYARNVGEPSANAQSRSWAALAACESGGDPNVISSNGLYHGLYQFSVPTWASVGGSGAASSASSDEQTYRAQILYDRTGPGSWPVCGAQL